MDVIIVGAGVGGLTLALELHRVGIPCRIYEAAETLRPIGAGINVLPHASRILCALGLEGELSAKAVLTRESAFFNRFGQLIYREPAGRHAGYRWPQFSIHRGDLQAVLLDAVHARIGADRIHTGWRLVKAEQGREVTAFFVDPAGAPHPSQKGDVLVGCDGLHSTLRKQLHPQEGDPIYSGVNMWRGVTVGEPFLTGATMVRAGWLASGKMVIYPIRQHAAGRQLINWVAEWETPRHATRDWNRAGRLDDFIHCFEDWTFDWLDVPTLIRGAEQVLEFPMVDQNPLERWSFGRLTLLGDAAHPMYPRGSNGAGQAILDAHSLATYLAEIDDPERALRAYEDERLPATTRVVLTNRSTPPDVILREIYLRTGDKPFDRIEDVISEEELRALSDNYKQVAGYDHRSLAT
ncbi:MAG TPA: flavin-dependent oxidoreductase [Myxococcaceae bacterium]|nr:flavin-dependent oxidoreductase [Myxococcaceae bacterium]